MASIVDPDEYCYHSPLGVLVVRLDGDAVAYCRFEDSGVSGQELRGPVREALDAYFKGADTLDAIVTAAVGSDFSMAVWQATRKVPYGTTATYADIAAVIGRPKACRAVAAALRANPVQLFVPCHRIVGSDGRLGGYRAGIDVKKALLVLEQK